MNKKNIILLVAMVSLGIVSSLMWIGVNNYRTELLSIYSYIKERPPIVWNRVEISYNFGIHYYDHGDSVSLHCWGKEGDEGVSVINLTLTKNELINKILSSNKFELVSIHSDKVEGHDVILVEEINKNDGEYFRSMYIPDINIAIGYEGPRDRYAIYSHIFSKLHIINSD